jgi:hypothetical protein
MYVVEKKSQGGSFSMTQFGSFPCLFITLTVSVTEFESFLCLFITLTVSMTGSESFLFLYKQA